MNNAVFPSPHTDIERLTGCEARAAKSKIHVACQALSRDATCRERRHRQVRTGMLARPSASQSPQNGNAPDSQAAFVRIGRLVRAANQGALQ
ncbi:hypothetical protein [Agrobacterium sp.]|uniref:hypothetical protein n=1 Tax=Agrobacterium sp. TaxID=361 RepID=UPI0028A71D6C|nr:hypothetical protein [Agrobacterium sp.]